MAGAPDDPIDKITIDLRSGGAFGTVMISDGGGEYTMRAVYVEADPTC